tara:strand:- start:2721 stop:3344 length:624 start_codon:yes stop_codon:yes gene_type:complete
MRSILITIALAIITGGCAIGVKHDYTYADPNWDVQTDKTVAVAVHDRRSYIVDNNKTPDFVGLSRGGWGNPFDVVTASGKPLAADMTTAVVNGLKARNIKAEAVTIAPAQGPAEARRTITGTGAARALLITLQEWKSDTYVATRLLYELRAQIFGADGKQLAETEFRGTDGLGSGLIPSETGKMVGPAYREKLDRIFKDTFMRDALK